MRIGHGFDVHAFTAGDHLMLGGVRIPFEQGFKAHSDGDVLIHAVCDAILGAAAMGDIGHHFPDNDEQFSNMDSRIFLRKVVAEVKAKRYRFANLDATIIAQAPKLAPHINEMRERIAEDLGVELGQVNIKATTTENLGYTGRGEGVAAHAVVLLLSN